MSVFSLLYRLHLIGMVGFSLSGCASIQEKWEHLFRRKNPSPAQTGVASGTATAIGAGSGAVALTNILAPTHPRGVFSPGLRDHFASGMSAHFLAAVDFNNDHFTDLVTLPEYYSFPEFYAYHPNVAKWKLVSPRPIDPEMRASFVTFVDLNRDGVRDLLLGGLNQKSELTPTPLSIYLGKKKKSSIHFQKAGEIPLSAGPQSTAIFLDFDLDGQLDLFVGQWYKRDSSGQSVPVSDQLFKGQGTKFENVSAFLKDALGGSTEESALPTISAQACDVNRDGYPDILTASSDGYPNRLWINREGMNKHREFIDQGEANGFAQDARQAYGQLTGGRSFGSDCGDVNQDGIVDLFQGELAYSYDTEDFDRSSLLLGQKNDSGLGITYLRQGVVQDLGGASWTHSARAAKIFDFDMDGGPELMIDNSGFPPHTRLEILSKDLSGRMQNLAPEWGSDILNPSSSIVFDLNRDGRPDILAGQSSIRTGADQKQLWPLVNHHLIKGSRWQIFMRGKRSNPEAWGAELQLKTNKRTFYQENKSPYGGPAIQHEEGVWFFLEKGETPVELKVRWPIRPLKWVSMALSAYQEEHFYQFTLCEPNQMVKGRKMGCRR